MGGVCGGVVVDEFAGRADALGAGETGFSAAPARFDLGRGKLATLFQTAQAGPLAVTDGGAGLIAADSRLGGFNSGQFVFGNRNFTPSETARPFTAGGVTLGLDYRLDPISAVGLAGIYFTGDGSVSGGTTNSHGRALSLYGTTEAGPLFLDGFLGGGFTDYSPTRNLRLAGPPRATYSPFAAHPSLPSHPQPHSV